MVDADARELAEAMPASDIGGLMLSMGLDCVQFGAMPRGFQYDQVVIADSLIVCEASMVLW